MSIEFPIIQLWPFISYNWLFQWDYTFYKWGDFLVLITGITRAITVSFSIDHLDPGRAVFFSSSGGYTKWFPGGCKNLNLRTSLP